jgi:hypothetical protein
MPTPPPRKPEQIQQLALRPRAKNFIKWPAIPTGMADASEQAWNWGSLPPLTPEATDNPRPVVVARHRAIDGAIRGIWLAAAAAGTDMRSRAETPGRGKRGRNRSSVPDAVGENTLLIKIFVT